MKSGFGHFDNSQRENFCAAVLLLAMEVDDGVKDLVADRVRCELGIGPSCPLLGFGREARLARSEDGSYARVDLWLLYGYPDGPRYAFIEVKAHHGWSAADVARQVRDQAERQVARSQRRIVGSILLAPALLCRQVRAHDEHVHVIVWADLLAELRGLPAPSKLTIHAIQHVEEQMDHPPGLHRPMSLEQFEEATTLVSCLRQFLVECVADLGGAIHGHPLYTTPGDGNPRRGAGWAWHGLAVPFTYERQKGRIGIYRYAETPPGEVAALEALWLEVYLGDTDLPAAFLRFAPPLLTSQHLAAVRSELLSAWQSRAAVVVNGRAP